MHSYLDEFKELETIGAVAIPEGYIEGEMVSGSTMVKIGSPSAVLRYGEGADAMINVYDLLERLSEKGKTDYRVFSLLAREEALDLASIIEEFGGKNFGEMLSDLFYGEEKGQVGKIAELGGFKGIKQNDTLFVDTDVCRNLEELLLPDLALEIDKIIQTRASGRRRERITSRDYLSLPYYDLQKYIFDVALKDAEVVKILDQCWAMMRVRFPDFEEKEYRFRGSQSSEDWLDTGLAGVSPGGFYRHDLNFERICSAMKERGVESVSEIEKMGNAKFRFIDQFMGMYVLFLYDKQLSLLALEDEEDLTERELFLSQYSHYNFGKDESLGVQVAPEIPNVEKSVVVVAEAGLIRMDVKMMNPCLADISFRIEISDNDDIEIFFSNDLDFLKERHGHVIEGALVRVDGIESFLSKSEVMGIVELVRAKRKFLNFDIDCEFGVTDDGVLYDFQTRLAPLPLGSSGEYSLKGMSEKYETSFVLGQKFFEKGKLAYINCLGGMILEDTDYVLNGIENPEEYILIVPDSMARYASFLMGMFCEKGIVFKAMIVANRGIDLTHSTVERGVTYFFKHNMPVIGYGEGSKDLMQLLDTEVGETYGGKVLTSSREVAVFSVDGRRGHVFVESEKLQEETN